MFHPRQLGGIGPIESFPDGGICRGHVPGPAEGVEEGGGNEFRSFAVMTIRILFYFWIPTMDGSHDDKRITDPDSGDV